MTFPASKTKPTTIPTADINRLAHRLSLCPSEFLGAPRIGKTGSVYVSAVVTDYLRTLASDPFLDVDGTHFRSSSMKAFNRLRLILVTVWLLYDDFFLRLSRKMEEMTSLLERELNSRAELADASVFVNSTERREELVRFVLSQLNVLPDNETHQQAEDRLRALDLVEQQRVIVASRQAEERAQKVREAIAKKRAEEAAAAKSWRE